MIQKILIHTNGFILIINRNRYPLLFNNLGSTFYLKFLDSLLKTYSFAKSRCLRHLLVVLTHVFVIIAISHLYDKVYES